MVIPQQGKLMLFNSFYYFIFLAIVFLLFYSIKSKFRWIILFAASIFFIGTISPNLIFFSLLFTILNYFLGIGLEISSSKKIKKGLFWSGIALNIGILSFYKYINFLFENINYILELIPSGPEIPYLSVIIPVGISYYTFQALGYLIRINRGAEKAEHHFGIFAIFLTFFPKFLAGPVERSNHFFPQINKGLAFNSNSVTIGLRLFIWGMFKKVVIGDNLVGPVMQIYNDVESFSGIPLLTVLVIQTIHLYCDFSGYTDMALGSAKIFGINLIDNFNRPFFSKTVSEFWRRWHISLSSWCNDFIFSPFIVKYRKMGNKAAIIGIFLAFFVIGIWHGANWTFVVLGIMQGVAISYEFYTKRWRLTTAKKFHPKLAVFVSRVLTFIFFCFTLVFFNAKSIEDAGYFISHLFVNVEWQLTGHDFILEKSNFFIALGAFAIVFIIEYFNEMGYDLLNKFLNQARIVRWVVYYFIILLIYFFSGSEDSFVYLQF
ncbi:MAG: hypothetical protein K8S16_10615 [Bacteroidales bacterium]|nr:hypothetical protein [Bacteroidales bacterium]